MRKTAVPLIGLCLWSLAGCASAPPAASAVDVAAEEAKIREREAEAMKIWAAKDAEKLLAGYADDATVMTPGMPPMKGKDAMRAALKELMADPNLKMELSTERVEVGKAGDVAFSQGGYQMTTTDPKTKKLVTDKGSYVTGFRKQADGSWKVVSDINVSEVPAGGGH